MRFPGGYLTFTALRLGVTIAVGWTAVDALNAEFAYVGEALSRIVQAGSR